MTMANATDLIPQGPIVDIKTTVGDIKIKLYDETPKHRDNFLKHVENGYYNGVLFHRVIKDFMVQTGDPESINAKSDAMLGSGGPDYQIDAEIDYPKFYHKYGALAAARTGDNVNPERKSSGSQFYIVTGKKFSPGQLEQMSQRQVMSMRQDLFNQLTKDNIEKIRTMQKTGQRDELEAYRQELIKEVESKIPDTAGMPEEIKKVYETKGGTPHLDGQYTVFGEVISGMETVEKIQSVETNSGDRPKEDIRIISMTVEK